MLHLETVEILPALVLGFELETGDWEKIREVTGTPPWLHVIEQQAGGLSMSFPEVFGLVLRFAANPDKGKPGLTEVMRAFGAMAADPDLDLLRSDFPELVGLTATWGDPYNTAALKCLHDFINTGLELPEFESGIEAFLRCVPADPLVLFAGWRIFSCVLKPKIQAEYPLSPRLDYLTPCCYDDGLVFDEGIFRALTTFGERLLHQSVPRIFLLWENSD